MASTITEKRLLLDGEWISNGAWIEASSVATPGGGVLVIYRDVTALKAREDDDQTDKD